MPTFLYTGLDEHGYTFAGARKAAAESMLRGYLNNAGISDYSIFISKTKYSHGMYSLVSCSELSLFCKQISVLLDSQMPFIEGLQLLSEQSDNKTLKTALDEICDMMDQGYEFTSIISMYTHIFPTHFVYMSIIGEQSDTLPQIYQDLSDYYAKEARLRKKIRRALTYPAILAAALLAVILLLVLWVMPVFSGILNDLSEELPFAANFVLSAANFFSWFIWVIILSVGAAMGGFTYYLRTDRGKRWLSRFKLNSPFCRYIYRRIISAKIAKSLAILIRSGAPFINALQIITPLMDNKFIEKEFALAIVRLKDNGDIGEIFGKMGFFPPMFVKLLVMGQKTGRMDEILDKAKDVFNDEAEEAIERMSTLIEPVMIIALSLIVGIILLSLILPMIDLMAIVG